jgi:hypothetical protein
LQDSDPNGWHMGQFVEQGRIPMHRKQLSIKDCSNHTVQ